MTDTKSEPSFEESLSELEAIVTQMETGDLPLAQALQKFERGVALSRQSQQALEHAEQKVKVLLSEQGNEQLVDLAQTQSE
ncbi:exodeoxyribonuclease VII small subunit [Alteromonas lipotrueiana]|uniref:exodeoxyribonuclease VII small subunit n=1 Tax=Alteromonas lipotrueiana TaxID=2803815 RepID=UPI001C43B9DC